MKQTMMLLCVFALFLAVNAQCTDGKVEASLSKYNGYYCAEESMRIYLGTDITATPVFTRSWTSGDRYQTTIDTVCITPFTTYTAKLSDTYGDGWDSSAYLTVYVSGVAVLSNARAIGSGYPYTQNAYTTYTFSASSLISYGAAVKYMNVAQVGNTWASASFPDTTWTEYTAGTFPAVSTITRYYRATVNFGSTVLYGMKISIKAKDAYIIYVNGIEQYRYGLPATSDANTAATITGTEYTERAFALPTASLLVGNSVTIAVELHGISAADGVADGFDLSAYGFAGESGAVSAAFIPASSTSCLPDQGNAAEGCPKAFDDSVGTKFLFDAAAGVDIVLYNGAVKLNGYQIASANDVPGRDPKDWTLYGTIDSGATWFFLDSQADQSFASRQTYYTYFVRSNSLAINGLKLEITNNNGATATQFSELKPIIANNPVLAPGIQYESTTFSGQTYISMNIKPISSGVINFTISPALPTGMFINANSGIIYGTPSVGVNQAYTVSGTIAGLNTPTSTTITLNIVSCVQPAMASLKFVKHNKSAANDEKFTVKTQGGVVVLEGSGFNNGADQTYNQCQSAGIYQVTLVDDGNNGWDAGAYLDVFLLADQGIEYRIERFYLMEGTTATYSFNTKLDIAPKSAWKYLDSAVIDPTWYNAAFVDTTWTAMNYVTLPQATNKVTLFRRTITGITRSSYKGIELQIKSRAGTVIYANGNEVYRINLADGLINAATTATGGDSSYVWRKVTLPISVLGTVGSSLTLAVAHVTLETPPYALDFDCTLRFIPSNNIIQTYTGVVVADDGSNNLMFDLSVETRWYSNAHDSQTEHYAQVLFTNQGAIFANKYCIISNYDAPRHDPADWKIYGTTDGSTWNQLSVETNISWEGRRQRQCFYIPSLTKPQLGYRFAPTKNVEISAGNHYAASEMEMYFEDIEAIVVPPLTMTPANLVAYKGVPVPALISSSDYYHNFSISPALPSPLSMDSSNGYINNSPSTLQSATQYTITATDIKGVTATTIITLTVTACSSPNTILTLQIVFEGGAGNEASWEIKTPSNTVLGSRTAAIVWATETFTYCTVAGTYTFTFGDTANDGWGTGVYYIKNGGGETLQSGTVAYGESPKVLTVSIGKLLEEGAISWKYLQDGTQPASTWTSSSFSDAAWGTAMSTLIPVPTSTTQYYRTSFAVTSIDSVNNAAIEFAAASYAGIIVYINGQEIIRANMPAGAVTKDTVATSGTGSYTYYKSSYPISNNYVIVGTNVLAVEVHKFDTIPAANAFDASVQYIANNSYRVTDGVPSSDIDKTDSEGYAKVFDNNIATKTLSGPRCVGAFYTWTYNNGRKEFVNKLGVTNGNDCNTRHPSGWILEGSNNNGNTWDILFGTRNQFWTSFRQTFNYNFYSNTAYNMYRFTATQCDNVALDTVNCGAGNFQLSEISLYADNTVVACQADGAWGPAPEGGFSFQSCPSGYTGYRRRACTSGVFEAEQNLCVVNAPSVLSYPQTIYTYYKGIAASTQAVYNGAELTFSVVPSLPAGLIFSSTTGAISGTPTGIAALANYNITCSNASGSLSTVLQITVSSLFCNSEGLWGQTEVNQVATRTCSSSDYSGSITRSCTYSNGAAVWGPENDQCRLNVPTITYSSPMNNFYKDDTITSLVPTTTGLVSSYSIEPTLPTGLIFNTQNGQISGNPTVVSTQTSYSVRASNSAGSGSFTLTISVAAVNCAADGLWPVTERTKTAVIACATGQSGTQTRVCNSQGVGYSNGVWGTIDSSNCFVYDSKENPGDGKVFLNVAIRVSGVSATDFDNKETYEAFRKTIVNYVSEKHSIASANVRIISYANVAAFFAGTTDVNVRILATDTQKDTVINSLNTFIKSDASDGFKSKLQTSGDARLAGVTATTVNGSITTTTNSLSGGIIALIVVLVVLVVAIAIVVAYCIYIRTKGKNGKNGKKLGAKKANATKTEKKPETKSAKAVKV